MENLTIEEVINGLHSKEYEEHHLILLQHLTNLTAQPEIAANKEQVIQYFTNIALILQPQPSTQPLNPLIVNLAIICLTNLTMEESSADAIAEQASNESSSVCKMIKFLLNSFLSYNPQLEVSGRDLTPEEWESIDPLQYMGLVMTNLCQVESGRKILLKQSDGFMPKMVQQIRSSNPIRRRGAVGCVRSCLFNPDNHWWILYEVKALTPILLPLVVATPFEAKDKNGMDPVLWLKAENPDQKHEPDLEIMRMLLECIILLCQKRGMREELRKRKVYPVIRNLDLKVEEENISNAVQEIVNFLMGDEDPDTPIETYEEHKQQKPKQLLLEDQGVEKESS